MLLKQPILLIAIVLVTFLTAQAQSVTLLSDNFNDNNRDTAKWDLGGSFPEAVGLSGSVTVAETSAQVSVTLPVSTSGYNAGGYTSVNSYNLTDGSVTIQLVQATNSAANTRFTLFDGSKYSGFLISGGLLYFEKTQGGFGSGNITYNATNHKWLRLSHTTATNEMIWETSTNGTTWVEQIRASSVGLALTLLRVEFNAGTGNTPSPGTAIFDDFTMVAPNRIPTSNAGSDKTATINVAKAITGSGSDTDGTIATYAWSKISGTGSCNFANAAAASTTITCDTTGAKGIRLTVTDDLGATATDDATITVIAAATASVAGPLTGTIGEPMLVDASATGSNAHYLKISFGDPRFPDDHHLTYPTPGARQKAAHAYNEAGTFTITVTPYNSADDAGTPATTTATISAPNTGGTLRTPATQDHAGVSGAITAAACGDVIQLTAGQNYDGTGIQLPNKSCTFANPITIRSTMWNNALYPGPYKRMLDTDTTLFASIRVSGAANNALSCADGCKGYRFEGIRFMPTGTNTTVILVFMFPASSTETDAAEPLDIIFNHCVLTQPSGGIVGNGLFMSGRKFSFLNGSITGIDDPNASEPKAILLKGGNGPFSIQNSLIQGTGASLFTGTDDPVILPHDVEVRRNWFYKPLTWRRELADGSQNPTWDTIHNTTNNIKSTLEYKNMVGSTLAGNVFENNWQSGQTGIHILLKATNQGGGGTSNTVSDVDLAYNVIKSANGAIQIAQNLGPPPGFAPTAFTKRVRIRHNVAYDISSSYAITSQSTNQANGAFMPAGHQGYDILVDHNTAPDSDIRFMSTGDSNQGVWERLTLSNNLFNRGGSGVIGLISQATEGTVSLNETWTTTWIFDGNLLFPKAGENALVPSRFQRTSADSSLALNQFLASEAAVLFTSAAVRDYTLQALSPGKNAAVDGTDVGANTTAVKSAVGASTTAFGTATIGAVTGNFLIICRWSNVGAACQ